MKTKIKTIVAAVLVLALTPLASASAIDVKPITTTTPTFDWDTRLLTVSLVINSPALKLIGLDGNFPLTENTSSASSTTYFTLDSMVPGAKLDAASAVVVNDPVTGLYGASAPSYDALIPLDEGDVIWTANYKLADEFVYGDYNFTVSGSAGFESLPYFSDEKYDFGITLSQPKHDVPVIEGDDTVYTVDSGENLAFKFDADYALLTEVLVDDVVADPSSYTVTPGSTIVEFDADYINGLGIGAHTVTANYSDGGVGVAHFSIQAAPAPVDPVEPDDSAIDDVVTVPDTGRFSGVAGSATAIGLGVFMGITIIPVIVAVSIERRYSRNKINFDKK